MAVRFVQKAAFPLGICEIKAGKQRNICQNAEKSSENLT
jgi:hypothetical protein